MQPARTNCSRNEQPTTAYRKVMCVCIQNSSIHCSFVVHCDFSLETYRSEYPKRHSLTTDMMVSVVSVTQSTLCLFLYFLYFFTLEYEFIPYNSRSNTICCNLYVSIFHLCPKHKECHRRRIQIESSGTIRTAKMMEKKREKICMQIGDLHFV